MISYELKLKERYTLPGNDSKSSDEMRERRFRQLQAFQRAQEAIFVHPDCQGGILSKNLIRNNHFAFAEWFFSWVDDKMKAAMQSNTQYLLEYSNARQPNGMHPMIKFTPAMLTI